MPHDKQCNKSVELMQECMQKFGLKSEIVLQRRAGREFLTVAKFSRIWKQLAKNVIKYETLFIRLILHIWVIFPKRYTLNDSVDLAVPTILPPWVWVPSTPSMVLSLKYLCYICHVKNENKQKEPGLAHFCKKIQFEDIFNRTISKEIFIFCTERLAFVLAILFWS